MSELSSNLRKLFAGVLLLFAWSGAYPQTATLPAISEKFDKHRRHNLQEKVFVHTDKEFYLAGEIMWFKIYNVDGTLHTMLDLSKVCYLEVIDAGGKPVLQTMVELNEGAGSGSFFLPPTLKSGNYGIRAYTSWMRNTGPDYFFTKEITIVNSLGEDKDEKRGAKEDYEFSFFPEGGNLVEGITSKVAFRGINNEGRGIGFEGSVVNQRGDTVARFRPLRFGIGTFSFTPVRDGVYKALIKLPNGKHMSEDLPAVNPAGYVMKVAESSGRQLEVRVQSANVLSGRDVYLFVHTRQKTVVAEKKRLEEGQARFLISKDALGDGISHFTIFDSGGNAVCERLYFKRPEQHAVLDASADRQEYSPRKQVTIALEAVDKQGGGREADLSVSVYDEMGGATQNDIFSYLWLSSDLRGNVESPEYYFLNQGAGVNEALDNLMLTHGWRRFRWNDVLANNPPAAQYLPEPLGHVITGRVVEKKTGAGADGIMTYLAVPGKRVQLYPSKSGTDGVVRYFTRSFYGANEIIVQSSTMQDSLYRVEIASPFAGPVPGRKVSSFTLPSVPSDRFLTQSVNMQVQNIFSGNRMKTFYRPQVDSAAFYGLPDKKYMLDHYTRFNTMEEVLREYVTEVVVTRNRKGFNLYVPVYSNGSSVLGEPFILFDGVPVFDRGDKIISVDPAKVEKIEVVNRNYFLGPAAFNGIVNFTTYQGDLSNVEVGADAAVLNYEGLQAKREFYSPKYDTAEHASSRFPDFRNVLYWSPEVKADKNGKAVISFYTSDQPGKYNVSINGITKDGQPLSKTIHFQVK